ncbi:MAG: hypothetical protein ACLFRO_05090 [Desulfobacterales bacterium]
MSGPFDELMKYEGDDFRFAVIQSLNLLYNLHMEAGQEHAEEHKKVSEARKRLAGTIENLKADLDVLNGNIQVIYNKVMNDGSTH